MLFDVRVINISWFKHGYYCGSINDSRRARTMHNRWNGMLNGLNVYECRAYYVADGAELSAIRIDTNHYLKRCAYRVHYLLK